MLFEIYYVPRRDLPSCTLANWRHCVSQARDIRMLNSLCLGWRSRETSQYVCFKVMQDMSKWSHLQHSANWVDISILDVRNLHCKRSHLKLSKLLQKLVIVFLQLFVLSPQGIYTVL